MLWWMICASKRPSSEGGSWRASPFRFLKDIEVEFTIWVKIGSVRSRIEVRTDFPPSNLGYVLDKKRSGNEKCSETPGGGFRRWVSRVEFTSLTYWNHDNLPSSDDLLPRCFHWFPVANAVSSSRFMLPVFVTFFYLVFAMPFTDVVNLFNVNLSTIKW